jgi:hypothetical protein
MMMSVVITIIVLSFASLARREQQQALDRQLSTQAQYAVETGISLASQALRNNPTLASKTNCTGNIGTIPTNYDVNNNAFITCLLINNAPTSLHYDIRDASQLIPLISDNGAAISQVTIAWGNASDDSAGAPTNFGAACNSATMPLSPAAAWATQCPVDLLRAELVPTSDLTFSTLQARDMMAFLYPRNGGGATTFNYTANRGTTSGQLQPARCTRPNATSPFTCTVTINFSNVLGSIDTSKMYLRLRAIFTNRRQAVTITAQDAGGNAVGLRGAQAVIDVTGRGSDVLRRQQVRVAIGQNGANAKVPDFALETTDSICKRYQVVPGTPVTVDPVDLAASSACAIP